MTREQGQEEGGKRHADVNFRLDGEITSVFGLCGPPSETFLILQRNADFLSQLTLNSFHKQHFAKTR